MQLHDAIYNRQAKTCTLNSFLSGVMATAECVKRIAHRQWDRWILAIGLTLKLVIEQSWQAGGHRLRSGDLPIVIDAHLYGAVAGALIGAALCARMAIIRQNSH